MDRKRKREKNMRSSDKKIITWKTFREEMDDNNLYTENLWDSYLLFSMCTINYIVSESSYKLVKT